MALARHHVRTEASFFFDEIRWPFLHLNRSIPKLSFGSSGRRQRFNLLRERKRDIGIENAQTRNEECNDKGLVCDA